MTQTRSRFEFQQEASLSQQLAHKDNDFVDLAGADPKISKKIQRLKVAAKHGLLNGILSKDELTIMLDFLNGDRKAAFATSEKVNEITKLGLQMPKRKEEFGKDEDEE